MCEQCDGPGQTPRPPENSSASSVSRRVWLAMGGTFLAGVGLGLLTCKNGEALPNATTKFAATGPGSTRAGSGLAQSQTVAASQPASQAAAETQQFAATETAAGSQPQVASAPASGPAPDLGAEVFPDATGRAIASPKDAPVIIVPRSDWTDAKPNFRQLALMNGIARLTVHHTAGSIQTDAWKPTAADLEGIRDFHTGTKPTDRNWADIAYHFAVDRAGRVWQARPLAYQGAHARGNNEHNLGIVLLGNFEVQSPSAAQLTALAAFVGFVRTLYNIPLANVFTHGELVDTSCPGKALQQYMDRTRSAWGEGEGLAWKPPVTTRTAPEFPTNAARSTRSTARE